MSCAASSSRRPGSSLPSITRTRRKRRSPAGARRPAERGLAVEDARGGAREEPRERQQVRAAARAAVGRGQLAEEVVVEPLAREREERRRGVAAALSARALGRLERHDRLARRERGDAALGRVDARVELHAVDHARKLERARHRHERALPQVEDLAAELDPAVAVGARLERQRARVERQGRRVGQAFTPGSRAEESTWSRIPRRPRRKRPIPR